MKKAVMIILALLLLSISSSATTMTLEEFFNKYEIKVTVIRDKTPFDGEYDASWDRKLQTPKEAGEKEEPPYSFFRVYERWNYLREARQPFKIGVVERDPSVSHSLGIEYFNRRYLIEPIFDLIKEDGSYVFRFVIKKGYGKNLQTCYEIPASQALILKPPTLGWKAYIHPTTVDAFNECGIRFKVYNWHGESFLPDYIEIKHVEFSRKEVQTELLAEYANNFAEGALKEYLEELTGSPSQPSPGPGPEPTRDCTDADNDGFYVEEHCDGPVDCDDTDKTKHHPGATEYCDGAESLEDHDCDGIIGRDEEACQEDDGDEPHCTDNDHDGFYAEEDCPGERDCDDRDPEGRDIHPGIKEDELSDKGCEDGIDNDCDGKIDGKDPDCEGIGLSTFTYRFYFEEDVQDDQDKSDFETVRDTIVKKWECREDLSELPIEEQREIVYGDHFADYFELRDASNDKAMDCSVTRDFMNRVVHGEKGRLVIECKNVEFSHNYGWVFKYSYKCSGGSTDIEEALVEYRIDEDGIHHKGWSD